MWAPLILFFPLLGYPVGLIALALLGMYVFYLALEAMNTYAVFAISEEDTRHRIERCTAALLVLPVYRFAVYYFRFSGFLVALTEDQQWTVPGHMTKLSDRFEITRLRSVQLLTSAIRGSMLAWSWALRGMLIVVLPVTIGIMIVAGRLIAMVQERVVTRRAAADTDARRALETVGVGALAVLVTVLIAFKLTIQLAVGADWDTYSFVANAAHWAGKGYGYTELFRPPLMSLLASVPMRLGFEGPAVLQSLDAVLALLSLGAFYLLFRRRFSVLGSSAAVLVLLASPPLWRWVGAGYTDLAAMGLCAISLLFVLKAGDDDPRWYIVAFPMFLAAGLMRHTSLLFGFSLAVAVLLRVRPFRHAKAIGWVSRRPPRRCCRSRCTTSASSGHALYPVRRLGCAMQGMGSSGDAHMEIASYLTGLPELAAPEALAPLTIGRARDRGRPA